MGRVAKAAAQDVRDNRLREAIRDAIPRSWLDPLLTGPKAVIGSPPYTCSDIERLLNAIRERVTSTVREDGGHQN